MYSKKAVTLALTLLLLSSCASFGLSYIVVEKKELRFRIPNLITGDSVNLRSRFAGGNGTENDPYRISNVTQLQDMNLDLSANYTLVNDIDASETSHWNDEKGFSPVANNSDSVNVYYFNGTPFTGSFDGQDYTIRELYINRWYEDYVGLFGYIGNNGRISNVVLIDCNIEGGTFVGGLVSYNSGIVQNCFSTGNAFGIFFTGGLVGDNQGTMQNCSATGKVTGFMGGGLIGVCHGMVMNCSATGNVRGSYDNGGLVGKNFGTIQDCSSTGYVSGQEGLGGLVGVNRGTVQNCYATGNVSGQEDLGGLVGENSGSVQNCYATGNVIGEEENLGGLVGVNSGSVQNCSATGNVSGVYDVGGLIGDNEGLVQNCYATGNVSGEYSIGGLVGNMSIQSTIINSFYCINYTAVENKHYVTPYGIYKEQFKDWIIRGKSLDIDDYLSKIPGTNGYIINSVSDMKKMLPFVTFSGYKFKQTANIDLSSRAGFYVPILNSTYNGDGYSISNLKTTYYNNSYVGMFGIIYSGGSVSKVSLINTKVNGERYVGGLIGYNVRGIIENCNSIGNVTGDYDYIGGLIGFNGGTVQNCYSTGNVIGDSRVGGLVGYTGCCKSPNKN